MQCPTASFLFPFSSLAHIPSLHSSVRPPLFKTPPSTSASASSNPLLLNSSPAKTMQPKSQPIFQKLSNFLKVSIFIAKMRRPIIPKLLFLKKSSRAKNFELLQYYNYGFVREFEFSPSTTPLFRFYRGRRRDVYSVLFPCRCLGSFGAEEGGGGYRVEEEALPAIEGRYSEALDWSESSDEDDSIDRRAELFIEKFYADMKMEGLASI